MNTIQVHFQDLILCIRFFNLDRSDHFLNLTGDRFLEADSIVKVAGQLLGERAETLAVTQGQNIGDDRPCYTAQ